MEDALGALKANLRGFESRLTERLEGIEERLKLLEDGHQGPRPVAFFFKQVPALKAQVQIRSINIKLRRLDNRIVELVNRLQQFHRHSQHLARVMKIQRWEKGSMPISGWIPTNGVVPAVR